MSFFDSFHFLMLFHFLSVDVFFSYIYIYKYISCISFDFRFSFFHVIFPCIFLTNAFLSMFSWFFVCLRFFSFVFFVYFLFF